MSTSEPVGRAIAARLRTLAGPARQGGRRAMAERVAMPFHNVNRYCTGEVSPPHDFLRRVALAYGVSLDWLYGLDGAAEIDEDTATPGWARRLQREVGEALRQRAAPPAGADGAEVLHAFMERWASTEPPPWAAGLTSAVIDEVKGLRGDAIETAVRLAIDRAAREVLGSPPRDEAARGTEGQPSSPAEGAPRRRG